VIQWHSSNPTPCLLRGRGLGDCKMNELSQCPFCGNSEVYVVANKSDVHIDDADLTHVWCKNCSSCGPSETTNPQSVEAWNKRERIVQRELTLLSWKSGYDSGRQDERKQWNNVIIDYCPHCVRCKDEIKRQDKLFGTLPQTAKERKRWLDWWSQHNKL